jgi:hypothetical protein
MWMIASLATPYNWKKKTPVLLDVIDLVQLQANWNSSTKQPTIGDGAREIAFE